MVELTIEQATALKDALEDYMRHAETSDQRAYDEYRRLWNAADIALVPLRGGPYSNENRRMEPPAPRPSWVDGDDGI